MTMAINAVITKDALGNSNKSVKQKAVVKPLMTKGAFLVLNLSEIQPTMGELIAHVKFSIEVRIPACVSEK